VSSGRPNASGAEASASRAAGHRHGLNDPAVLKAYASGKEVRAGKHTPASASSQVATTSADGKVGSKVVDGGVPSRQTARTGEGMVLQHLLRGKQGETEGLRKELEKAKKSHHELEERWKEKLRVMEAHYREKLESMKRASDGKKVGEMDVLARGFPVVDSLASMDLEGVTAFINDVHNKQARLSEIEQQAQMRLKELTADSPSTRTGEQTPEADPDGGLCGVCQENEKDVRFLPCGHTAICWVCFERYVLQLPVADRQCPQCYTAYESATYQ